MPKGPKGEHRFADPVKNAMLVLKIAVDEITEDQARELVLKDKGKKRLKKAAKRSPGK